MVNRFNQSLDGTDLAMTLIPVIYYSKLKMSVTGDARTRKVPEPGTTALNAF